MIELPRLIFGPEDVEQFAAFQHYEAERFAAKQRGAGARQHLPGMRLSIDCPVCRVKAAFDDWFKSPVDEGDGDRGHEMESRVRAKLLHQGEHVHQPPIAWSHGVSAWDFETGAGVFPELEGVTIEVKSGPGQKASSAHRRQVARMCAADDGTDAGLVVHFVFAHPGNYRASHDVVTVDRDAYDAAAHELELCGKAYEYLATLEDPTDADEWSMQEWWRDLGFAVEDACGRCFPHEPHEANAAIEKLMFKYDLAKPEAEKQLRGLEWVKAEIGVAYDAQAERYSDEERPRLRTYGVDYSIMRDKRGALLIRECAPMAEAVVS